MFTTEQMNRIVLMMAGLLLLLVFMDHQARRHYEKAAFRPDTYAGYDGAEKVKQSVEPIRASVDEIFGSPAVNSPEDYSIQNNPSEFNIKLRPLETSSVDLYFIRFKSSQSEMVRVRRDVKTEKISISGLIALLQKGPLPGERGLLNAFDESIRVHSAVMKDGIVTLDVDEGMGSMGEYVIEDRLAQISLTLFQFPEVQGIHLLLNGKNVTTIGSAKVKIPEIITMPQRKVIFYP